LLFQEPIADLKARLRRVEVTLAANAPAPARLPADWLEPRPVGSALSFRRFDALRELSLRVPKDVRTHQRIVRPAEVYDRVRDQPVRLELDYWLTLLGMEAAATMPATRGSGRAAAFGACEAKIDGDGDGVELGCVRPGPSSSCVIAALANPKTATATPSASSARPTTRPVPSATVPGRRKPIRRRDEVPRRARSREIPGRRHAARRRGGYAHDISADRARHAPIAAFRKYASPIGRPNKPFRPAR
jgi:hypothetical protein